MQTVIYIFAGIGALFVGIKVFFALMSIVNVVGGWDYQRDKLTNVSSRLDAALRRISTIETKLEIKQ